MTAAPANLSIITRAAEFAARMHTGQTRKGAAGEPYVNHVIEVADMVARATAGEDPNLAAAALLHDTVEDTPATVEMLIENFGEDVASLVMEVTDDKSLPKAERKAKQIEHAAEISDRARMIKLADKTSNLRGIVASPPEGWDHERKLEYLLWAKAVIDNGCRGINADLERWFDRAWHAGMDALGEKS